VADEQCEESGGAVCHVAGYRSGGEVGDWFEGDDPKGGCHGEVAAAVGVVGVGDAVCGLACVSTFLALVCESAVQGLLTREQSQHCCHIDAGRQDGSAGR